MNQLNINTLVDTNGYHNIPFQKQTDTATINDKLKALLQDKDKRKLTDLNARLEEMKSWPSNWNSYGAKKPSIKSITTAYKFIESFYSAITKSCYLWENPNITASSEGEIVFEWWHNSFKITLYVSSKKVDYIKVFGDNIDDMEDGTLLAKETAYINLWEWLVSGENSSSRR